MTRPAKPRLTRKRLEGLMHLDELTDQLLVTMLTRREKDEVKTAKVWIRKMARRAGLDLKGGDDE